ncbi:MAG: efflux RND transporter periplasmic adaptor subunit [candidate division Zixibacteria bacterium]|nr:efflux RND transporter periplasmic adaptor subunit [candidate division Zixibacteria bacterium]
MNFRKNKKLLWIIGGIAVVAIIVGNVVSTGENATKVKTETVEIIDITEEVSASGYVQPQTRVNITAEVTAEIIGIPVIDGQQIHKNDLLVLLDTVQLQKDVDQSLYALNEIKSRMEGSKATFKQANEEYDRQKRLYERNLTSETVYTNAEYTYLNYKYSYEAMVSQTKSARARYEKAVDFLNRTSIAAPMDGIITYIDAEVGEIAPAQNAFTQGKTLMTISDMSTFEVEVDVDETEIIKIALGQEAKIEIDAFIDTVFAGEVIEIGNTAIMSGLGTQDQATNFKVKVLFKETNTLIRPGMSATVDIVTNEVVDALSVPYGAIVMRSLDADSLAKVDDSGGLVSTAHAATTDEEPEAEEKSDKKEKKEVKGVFVVSDGQAKFVPVETGIADQKSIEVVIGINESDTVITGPFRTLRSIKDGDKIETENDEEKDRD